MSQMHTALRDIGLREKERVVYLQILQLGTTPASTVSKRTGIKKGTVQYICQQLVQKGLVSKMEKNSTFFFTPESPERLLMLLQHERQSIDRREKSVQSALGDLSDLMQPNAVLPRVEFFESKDHLRTLYEKMLEVGEPVSCFCDCGEMWDSIPEISDWVYHRRKSLQIPLRVISPHGYRWKDDPKDFREVRSIAAEEFPFDGDIQICGPLVGICSFDEHATVGVLIRDSNIAKNLSIIFEQLWKRIGVDGE